MISIKSQIGDLVIVEISASEELPDLGKTFSLEKNKIGKVFDIIGNVKNPYLVVKRFKRKEKSVVIKKQK